MHYKNILQLQDIALSDSSGIILNICLDSLSGFNLFLLNILQYTNKFKSGRKSQGKHTHSICVNWTNEIHRVTAQRLFAFLPCLPAEMITSPINVY